MVWSSYLDSRMDSNSWSSNLTLVHHPNMFYAQQMGEIFLSRNTNCFKPVKENRDFKGHAWQIIHQEEYCRR